MNYEGYTIRQFLRDDVSAYKAMRLEALQQECGMFGNSYEFEASFSNDQWLARIENPDGACFGLYYEGILIGITGIVGNHPVDGTAYMTQSYIRKDHRGRGLSKMLYDARLAWAAQHVIERLVIGHRESNLVSRSANQHYGFTYTHKEQRTWPDGNTEDMVYYELLLKPA